MPISQSGSGATLHTFQAALLQASHKSRHQPYFVLFLQRELHSLGLVSLHCSGQWLAVVK